MIQFNKDFNTITVSIPSGSLARFIRVKELKDWTDDEAIEFCISAGWLAAEKLAFRRNQIAKKLLARHNAGTCGDTCLYCMKEKKDMEDLKETVTKILIADYDFTVDEAEETVTTSMSESPDMWNENSDAKDLAKFLASDDDDE